MTKFGRRSCVAFTWSPDGQAWAVHLRGTGDGCVVKGMWQAQVGRETALAEALSDACRQLGVRESTAVVAGAQGVSGGTVDLTMPSLRADEMRSALTFELKKHSPLPADKLVWGYRELSGAADGKKRVRLFFLRQNVWDKWLEAVSGLPQVDLLIPPDVALDPVFSDRPVFLRDSAGVGFSYLPAGEGGRDIVPGEPDSKAVFGSGEAPLDVPELDLGSLAGLSSEEQRAFSSAVLMAMYGLTPTFWSDVDTGIAVPHNLRPRRHRASRLLALGLFCYIAVMGGVGIVRAYQDRRDQLGRVQAELRRVESDVEQISGQLDGDAAKYMDTLRGEMMDAYTERPSMTTALIELTRTIGSDAWCQSLEWRDGGVTIQIKESSEDVELVRALEFSPVLGDVVQISKSVGPTGEVVRRFQMNARFDMENERVSPPPRPEESPASGDDDADVPADGDDGPMTPSEEEDTTVISEEGDDDAQPVDDEGDAEVDGDETEADPPTSNRKRSAPPPPPPPPGAFAPAEE